MAALGRLVAFQASGVSLPGERTATSHPVELAFAGGTHVGRRRSHNEDAFACVEDLDLFLVADGMGGHQAGDIASAAVRDTFPRAVESRLETPWPSWSHTRGVLKSAARDVSSSLRTGSERRPDLAGMGSTLVAAHIDGEWAHICHLGDSRAYLLRNDRLGRLTRDHNIGERLVKHGALERSEMRQHPNAQALLKYVGMQGEAVADIRSTRIRVGDRLLLCSDGLSDMVTGATIGRLLRSKEEPHDACATLVEAANHAGGHDNITVLVIDVRAMNES